MKNLNELTDEQLAVLYQDGDNQAFDLLLSRTEVKLFSYILFMVHDETVANDIFHKPLSRSLPNRRGMSIHPTASLARGVYA